MRLEEQTCIAIGSSDAIGSVASWLSYDEGEYINSMTIFVDGSMTCYRLFATDGYY
ncbi:hypothetical protein [Maribacter sp. ACAM166]|uniref:hypothetical protein n=1 Tax=Maribacter sp. ACAM166 TaxID=2508996 RepID=UPI001BB1087F|nr:hypothetical protein [Maribacter sp. ACAM166]